MRSSTTLLTALSILAAAGLWHAASMTTVRTAAANPSQPGKSPGDRHFPTVRDFGARGDGETDDTRAIQQAVDSRIGAVRFPRGRYRITKTIEVNLDTVGPTSLLGDGTATIVMAGAGPAFRLTGTHEGTASPKTVKDNVWLRQRTPLVDGLEIIGAHPDADGVEASGTMQATFTRLTIRRARHAIHLTRRNRNVLVSNCHLYENRGIGLFLNQLNLHQVNVDNCHISYNGGGGIVVRGSEIRNLQIACCDIEGNMDPQQAPIANVLLDTTEGSIREGALVGCTIQHNHVARDSANVRFIGRSAQQPQKVGNFTIADNAMSDVAVNIHLQHARGVTITGNTLWKAFSHNLLVEGSSHVVVGANLLDRNPDYRPNDSRNAVEFLDCRDCTLQGLHVNHVLSSAAGLILRRCRTFNVTGCTILNCDGGGLLLDDVAGVRVSDCLVRDDRPRPTEEAERTAYTALRLTRGSGNMIVDNLLVGKVDVAVGAGLVQGNYAGR